ncbi:MAG: sugar transferase [Actinobacteria bacterium]|nr:sugar transferase [Actinomycetota bacterium]
MRQDPEPPEAPSRPDARSRPGYEFAKRLTDLALGVLALALLSPFLVVLAYLINRDSPGPVLYRGLRIGRYGKPFRIYKFRTMEVDAEIHGGSSTPDDDPRITRIGAWLRSRKIDELPQLFNVIKGEMSLVGPRPQVADDVDRYTSEECALLSVLPGLTDLASLRFRNEGEILRGHGDPDRAYIELIRPEKIRLGLDYVRRRSFVMDCRIIWETVRVVAGFSEV